MAYNEHLADRVRELISETHLITEEKKMFGGLCFMVNDKMCVGIKIDSIMVRFDKASFDEIVEKEGCRPMVQARRTAKGFAFVDMDVLKTKKQLNEWVQLALAYNKVAKASKKKKR